MKWVLPQVTVQVHVYTYTERALVLLLARGNTNQNLTEKFVSLIGYYKVRTLLLFWRLGRIYRALMPTRW